MLAALVKKELQLLRPVLIAMAIVFTLIYVVLPAFGTIQWYRWMYRPTPFDYPVWTLCLRAAERFAERVTNITPLAWIATLLFMPVLACNAFALEQRERWNELVVMLPLPAEERNRIKLGVFGGIAIGLVLLNLALTLTTVVLHTLLLMVSQRLLEGYQLSAVSGLICVALLVVTVVIFLLHNHTSRWLSVLIVVLVCLGLTAYIVRITNDASGGNLLWQFKGLPMWRIYTPGNVMAFLSLAVGSFGLAWLLSAVTRSPTLSAAISLGVVDGLFVLFDGMRMVVNMWGTLPWIVFAIITGFGLACLAAGQMIQSRNIGVTEVL